MMGSAAAVVADFAGSRHLISLDKGHKLEIRPAGGVPSLIESRPVTEFSAAIDNNGRLHVAAWLLSRQLMYYTSGDGDSFTRSTLLKSDGALRLKDCLVFADTGVSIVYVAETEYADTLVCYRNDGGEWEGKRIVEVQHPQRLSAFQFDGAPGGACIVYAVRDSGRTVVASRPAGGDSAPETLATITGGLSDFCVLTSGGARQACWIADGHLMINGLRQSEEPWSCTWPYLRRDDGGVQCLWLENGTLSGVMLGAQRARLRPATISDALSCMLAMPGELRRSIVESQTLKEIALLSEMPERQPPQKSTKQSPPGRPEGSRGGQGDITLTDVVRNQAIYITRMQESLSGMERNMLRMQAEVNKLSREVTVMMRDKESHAKPTPQFRVASARVETPVVEIDQGVVPDDLVVESLPTEVEQPEPEAISTEPEVEEQSEPEPEAVEQSEPEPEVVEQSEAVPEVVEQSELEPEVVEQSAPEPEAVEQSEAVPEVVEQSELEPEVVEQSEPEPEAVEQYEPEPEVVGEAEESIPEETEAEEQEHESNGAEEIDEAAGAEETAGVEETVEEEVEEEAEVTGDEEEETLTTNT